jgi:hypothetical protein
MEHSRVKQNAGGNITPKPTQNRCGGVLTRLAMN